MTMHNPPRPGEFIAEVYLKPNGISGRDLASRLGVSPSTLNRILTNRSVSSEMALRLSTAAQPALDRTHGIIFISGRSDSMSRDKTTAVRWSPPRVAQLRR